MSGTRIAVALTALNSLLLLMAVAQGRSTASLSPAPALRGRSLELVDERGRSRARLNVEEGGEVVFRLLDDRGVIRVKLGAGEDGSGLLLANDAAAPGIHLLAKAAGSSLRVVNKDGRERLIVP